MRHVSTIKNISFCELKACRRLLSLPGKFFFSFDLASPVCANCSLAMMLLPLPFHFYFSDFSRRFILILETREFLSFLLRFETFSVIAGLSSCSFEHRWKFAHTDIATDEWVSFSGTSPIGWKEGWNWKVHKRQERKQSRQAEPTRQS